MDNTTIPQFIKVMKYEDDSKMVDSYSKIMDANNMFIQKLTEQLIEAASDGRLAEQRIISQMLESFAKHIDEMTSSFRDNVTNANTVFEQRLDQNQRDVGFPKFFSIKNKNEWSRKAWNHAFSDYREQVDMISRAHQRYNESLAMDYVQLVTSCLNLLTSGGQSGETRQNPIPLLTGMIVDAARKRGMVK